jgi:hypothetical protein
MQGQRVVMIKAECEWQIMSSCFVVNLNWKTFLDLHADSTIVFSHNKTKYYLNLNDSVVTEYI